jgi:prolyl-tRNA editing enzyme YbaK/EbsC (Cys-tRNA(Pro) deacylase)
VSPIGVKTPLPIIMSHKITQLQPDFFFLGAGEVELEVGFSAPEFVDRYNPMVVDCTY